MSQVDYIHFFSNIFWSSIFFWLVYFIFCVFFVQVFYKIFRLRFSVFYFIFLFSKCFNLNWNFFIFFYINRNLYLKYDFYLNIVIFFFYLKNFLKKICL